MQGSHFFKISATYWLEKNKKNRIIVYGLLFAFGAWFRI